MGRREQIPLRCASATALAECTGNTVLSQLTLLVTHVQLIAYIALRHSSRPKRGNDHSRRHVDNDGPVRSYCNVPRRPSTRNCMERRSATRAASGRFRYVLVREVFWFYRNALIKSRQLSDVNTSTTSSSASTEGSCDDSEVCVLPDTMSICFSPPRSLGPLKPLLLVSCVCAAMLICGFCLTSLVMLFTAAGRTCEIEWFG